MKEVSPPTTLVAKGLTQQPTTMLPDGSMVDVTDDTNGPMLDWTTCNTCIATIGSAGSKNDLATEVSTGTVTITTQIVWRVLEDAKKHTSFEANPRFSKM